MHAPSATSSPTELGAAPAHNDPRSVSTPLDADGLETLLKKLGLLEEWSHVINGIRNGFDVGIREIPPRSFIFDNHNSANLVRTSNPSR